MSYTYRVTKAFKRVGDGERQFSVGDKLTLDRPAKSLTHLELLHDDNEATEPVQEADKPRRGRPRKDQA